MKNKDVKIITIIIIVTFLCGMFSVSSYAISEKCAKDHFDGLNKLIFTDELFVPPNPKGSCPYVAMSMFLSFYDTYWNERFVPDNLEWQNGEYDRSSDSLEYTFHEHDEASAWNDYSGSFKEFINNTNNQDTFLQPYLYSIGKSKLYHLLEPNNFGLNDQQMVNVLTDYLYNTCDFTTDEVTVNYLKDSDDVLFAKMKEQIDKGFPVMFIGKKTADENAKNTSGTTNEGKIGHVMIAYSVEQNEGVEDIKLHLGYSYNSPYDWVNTTEYQYLNAIIWLEVDEALLPHEHSYNYVESGTNTPLCACQIYESHPNHSSNHYYVQKIDYSKHWQECCCGDSIIEEESHNYSYTYYNAIQHKAVCDDCEYETITPHSYVEKNSKTQRWKECACGDIVVLHYHEYEYLNLNGNQHVATCTICDYSISENHMYSNHEKISSTQHESSCVCGDTRTESHAGFEYKSISNFKHEVYCKCGYLIGTSNHVMTTVGTRNICTICGASFSNFSDITIKGAEDEHETHIE